MSETTNFIGLVCECSEGRIGVVTGRSTLPWGLSWVGIGLDNGSLWSGRDPKVIRVAERDDIDNAIKMAWEKSQHRTPEPFTTQYGEMPDNTMLLVLEMLRAGLAEHARQMRAEHERWMDS